MLEICKNYVRRNIFVIRYNIYEKNIPLVGKTRLTLNKKRKISVRVIIDSWLGLMNHERGIL